MAGWNVHAYAQLEPLKNQAAFGRIWIVAVLYLVLSQSKEKLRNKSVVLCDIRIPCNVNLRSTWRDSSACGRDAVLQQIDTVVLTS